MAQVDVTAVPITITESLLAGLPVGIVAAPIVDTVMLGATVDPYVYVVDSGNNRVNAYDYDGILQFSSGTFGSGDGQFSNPYGIASNGTYLFITDRGNNRVQVFTMLGVYVTQFGSGGTGAGEFDTPMGIAVDSSFIWVVDNGNNRFQLFDLTTYTFVFELGEFGSGVDQFDGPTDCAVDNYYFYIDDPGNLRTLIYPKTLNRPNAIESEILDLSCAIVSYNASVSIVSEILDLGIEITSHNSTVANIDSEIVSLTSRITSLSIITATIESEIIDLSADVEAGPRLTAAINSAIIDLTAELHAIGEISAAIDAGDLLGIVSTIVSSVSGAGTFKIIVINTKNKAVTEYTNYDFNSMTYFAGKNIGADASGIYEMTGEDDDTIDVPEVIAASIQTGDFDLHSGGQIRRLIDANIFGKCPGDMNLIFRGNIDTLRQFNISGLGLTEETTVRQKFGRGLKDRVFNLELQNVDGADFEVEQIAIEAHPELRQMKRG